MLFLGDVQGKHEDGREVNIISPSEPREVLSPPDRAVMVRRLQPSYQVQPVSTNVLVSADSNVPSKRRMSLAGSTQQSTNVTASDPRSRRMSLAIGHIIGVSPYYSVLGQKARDVRRRQSESKDVSPSDSSNYRMFLAGSLNPYPADLCKKARGNRRRQSESMNGSGPTFLDPTGTLSRAQRMGTVTLPSEFQVARRSSYQRQPLGEVSNILPLAEAITQGNSS